MKSDHARPVSVYRTAVDTVYTSDWVIRYATATRDPKYTPPQDGEVPINTIAVQHHYLQVHEIRHHHEPSKFVALEQELDEVVQAVAASRVAQLRDEHRRDREDLRSSIRELQGQIAAYNRLPWYRRIFTKIS